MQLIPADPRFALATDAARLAPRLEAALGVTGRDADWSRLAVVRVLPDADGFVIQYAVPRDGRDDMQVGAHLAAAGAAIPGWAVDSTRGRAWLSDPGLAVAAFPHDPVLGATADLLDNGWRRELAARLGGDDADVPSTMPRVLGYRLGKRCVVRLDLAAGEGPGGAPRTVVAKAVRPRRAAAIAAAHGRFAIPAPGATAFALPRLLYVDERRGILVMEDAAGTTLHEQTGAAGLAGTYAAAGSALREFHSRPAPEDLDQRSVADELGQLRAWVAIAAALFPALGGAWGRGFEQLAAGADRLGGAPHPTLLHRDFYDKQVLATPGRLTLLDLDTLTVGDSALDLGNFLAHVRLRQLQAPRHARALAAAGNAFQDAYGTHNELLPRLSWWRAAATLRLSALYALRPRWRSLVPQLLEEVETCLRLPERIL